MSGDFPRWVHDALLAGAFGGLMMTGTLASAAEPTKVPSVLRSAFVYTEMDANNHVDCAIRASLFVEAVQRRLTESGVAIVGPHAGEDVAFYITVNALRMPTSALTGGCVADVNLLVHRPTRVRLPGATTDIAAKAVLCQRSAIVAPEARKNPTAELLVRAADFADECIGSIRQRTGEPLNKN